MTSLVVILCFRKLCWCSAGLRCSLSVGRVSFSRLLAIGARIEMSIFKFLLSFVLLFPGSKIKCILRVFHTLGNSPYAIIKVAVPLFSCVVVLYLLDSVREYLNVMKHSQLTFEK